MDFVNGHKHNTNYVDDDHDMNGTQVDPPMEIIDLADPGSGITWVGYHTIIRDLDGNDDIDYVHADVYHPETAR